jgi:hypothetical protein
MLIRSLILISVSLVFANPSCTKKSSEKKTPPQSSAPKTDKSPKDSDQNKESSQAGQLNGSTPGKGGPETGQEENPGQSAGKLPSLKSALALNPDLLKKSSQELLALYRPFLNGAAWNPKMTRVDPILEWNQIMLDANARDYEGQTPEQAGPTRASRAFAITQLAMYDAYVSVIQASDPYLPLVKVPANTNATVAASVAAYVSLHYLYPGQATRFEQAIHTSLQRYSYGVAEYNGILLGKYMALRMLSDRRNDGSEVTERYEPSDEIGTHDVDPLNPGQGFLDSNWGNVRPFALPNATRFAAPSLPSLGSREYAAAFEEVKTLGGDGVTTPTTRTKEQTIIGIFWAYDGTPGLGVPPRLYNQIVRTIAIQKQNEVSENARLFALVNMAMADAGIQAWADKYNAVFWRPIRGIRLGDQDGNFRTVGNAQWTPLGAPASNTRRRNFTPNFPAYISGHAIFGAASMGMIQNFYGTDSIAFSLISDEFNGRTTGSDGKVRPVISRSYKTLTQAIEENSQSRTYLGVHWRFDQTEGQRAGLSIAEFIAESQLRLR